MGLMGLATKIGQIFSAAARSGGEAAKATADVAGQAAAATATTVGKGVTATLDGIEYIDTQLEKADAAIEDAAATAGKHTAGIFGEAAKPQGERIGRVGYKAAKIGVNFLQLPMLWKDGVDLLRKLRR